MKFKISPTYIIAGITGVLSVAANIVSQYVLDKQVDKYIQDIDDAADRAVGSICNACEESSEETEEA